MVSNLLKNSPNSFIFVFINQITSHEKISHNQYLNSVLLHATNDDQLFYLFLYFHMVFNNSSLFMSMSKLN
jgi:hypothetical protein